MTHRITSGIVLVFLSGMIFLFISLRISQQASRSRRIGDPFEQKAAIAFFSLLLAVALLLVTLFWLTRQLQP